MSGPRDGAAFSILSTCRAVTIETAKDDGPFHLDLVRAGHARPLTASDRLPADGLALVLFVQPLLQRGEVVEDGGSVQIALAGHLEKGFLRGG